MNNLADSNSAYDTLPINDDFKDVTTSKKPKKSQTALCCSLFTLVISIPALIGLLNMFLLHQGNVPCKQGHDAGLL
jgi:hypothetical protein